MMSPHRSAHQRGEMFELLRYFEVMVLGLCIDIAVGIALRWSLALPLVAAGAAGFAVGVAVNYALCETWVFRSGQLTLRRLGQAYFAGLAALGIRLAAIWALGVIWQSAQPIIELAKLAIAAGLSVGANFVMLRRFLRPTTTS